MKGKILEGFRIKWRHLDPLTNKSTEVTIVEYRFFHPLYLRPEINQIIFEEITS